MGGKRIAVLLLIGTLSGFAPFAPLPHTAAHGGASDGITSRRSVEGEVTQKFAVNSSNSASPNYMIAVEGQPYSVTPEIYNQVDVGTVVQFDGTNWTIISGAI